jgi:hypothetical protein
MGLVLLIVTIAYNAGWIAGWETHTQQNKDKGILALEADREAHRRSTQSRSVLSEPEARDK